MIKIGLLGSILLLLILIGLDQGLKWLVSVYITMGQSRTLLPGIISLTNVRNNGAAWSILPGQRFFFIIVALVALLVLGFYLFKCRFDWRYEISLSLLLAGTIGNVINRIFSGSVIDMFQLRLINFPIFNLADSYLTIGVFLIMLLLVFNQDVRGPCHES